VSSLKGVSFVGNETPGDVLDNPVLEEREATVVEKETDRVYLQAPDAVTLKSSTGSVEVVKEVFQDTVVWNIHEAGAKKMGDLGDDEWQNYICIEAGAVAQPVTVEAGQSWTGSQMLTASRL
jgi:glucose-6-phosphate 1-epimerase